MCHKIYNIRWVVRLVNKPKKMGRPTDSPKTNSLNFRYDEEFNNILEQYMDKFKVSKTTAVRNGIKKLKDDL